ncbi:ankyrin repeat-containing domain protein [Xylaria castorea]|nr:ankyrin repeat-containing domain protein [Xylaria castorea]
MVQTLLHSGASVNSVNSLGQTALHISSQYNHVWVVNALMDYLPKHPTPERNVTLVQDSSDDTAFIIAVRQGFYEVARAVIEKSAPLKSMELQGQKKALIESVGPDRVDLVELLLDHEWDVNARDQNGDTALHLAAGRGLLSVMELLISRGADCNAHGKNGGTPLHRAIIMGGKAAVQTLLKKGADINAKDNEDTTPLWRASYYGRFSQHITLFPLFTAPLACSMTFPLLYRLDLTWQSLTMLCHKAVMMLWKNYLSRCLSLTLTHDRL